MFSISCVRVYSSLFESGITFGLLDFSIILKPIPPKMLTETQASPSAFLIHNKKNGDSFEFTESGVLNINTGTVNINAGTVNISGDLNVTGVSTANDHVSSGISGKGHVHSGITTGGDDTKVPK